jgi:hypothetical protein
MAQFVGSLAAAADSGYTQGTVWTAGILTFGNDTTALSCGIRWLNVTVPAAATISSASIHVRARTLVGTITNIHLKMRGHKGDAPQWAEGTFEPDNNFTATTAAPDWDPASWTIDAYYDVDVTTVVQEIVNGTWASGNDMAIVFFDDSSTLDNRAQIWWYADGDATANVLTINYTEAAEDVAPSAANQPLERPFNMATLRR